MAPRMTRRLIVFQATGSEFAATTFMPRDRKRALMACLDLLWKPRGERVDNIGAIHISPRIAHTTAHAAADIRGERALPHTLPTPSGAAQLARVTCLPPILHSSTALYCYSYFLMFYKRRKSRAVDCWQIA
jgi:hypothetical protein